MNNLEELICQSRIKEISRGSSPLIGEKERLALTALHWHQEHQIAVQAFQETGGNLLLAQEQIADLIAQLEAAQKEVGAAAYRIQELESQWENRAPTPFAYDAACSALHIYQERAEKAEAELSAANEKLSKPVVLPDDGLEDCINMWPDNWRNDFDTGYNFGIWRCEQNIKATGFTVEGE
ncbi:hypothetical protein ACLMPM_22650 [Yersinia enterocolitica]|uniref:hypothetical protein n=1 Tax=Yersinia enterocolitica TaxID=630 RepID=UPI00398D3EC3